ncbi:tetratricopeptide repeat protein [bacterium]|nr:tetratricopeptide repeat protein [bacterium]
MKKKISLLLTAIMLAGIVPQISYGFVNPLKNYDLYADTHNENSPRDNAMSEMYYTNNAQNSPSTNRPPQQVPTTEEGGVEVNVEIPQRRNDYLRESSRKVFGTGAGNWTKKPYFYDAPNLESIKQKYHLSNFAGCMQECEAYVQSHPYDTLGYYYLAMSYAKCGKKEDAILAYERVINLNDNPMIVKYATNGRNCVIGNEDEAKCFQNVNEPEYLYPYRDMAGEIGLTPVNPQDLINRNLTELQQRLNPNTIVEPTQENQNGQENQNKITLPFQNQDDSLDRFINAPYGSGFSPELEQEYKQLQLKNLQQQINSEDDNSPGKYFQNIRDIKNFDKKKSEGEETIKLALADQMDVEDILKNPEYIQNKKELDEIKMMFGDYGTNDVSSDITTMLPQLAKDGQNVSPEVVQMMMMQTVMPNIIDTNSSGF